MTREVPAVNGRLSWLGPGLSWKWMFATLSPALSRSLHILDEYPRGRERPLRHYTHLREALGARAPDRGSTSP